MVIKTIKFQRECDNDVWEDGYLIQNEDRFIFLDKKLKPVSNKHEGREVWSTAKREGFSFNFKE